MLHLNQPAAASGALAADSAAQDLPHVCPLGVDPADLAGPVAQRNLAWEHHQASFQEQVAAGNRIQPEKNRFLEIYHHNQLQFQP